MSIKKSINYFVLFLTLAVLQACSAIAEPQLQADAKGQMLMGHYIYGHEVNSFQPCEKNGIFWVKGSNETLKLMASRYFDYADKPYDEVFIELIGNYTDKATDGFAMDYDGQVQVVKMVLMRKKLSSDCN